jgi:outer membrane protein assembly factor BamD (BamD/ComL family)
MYQAALDARNRGDDRKALDLFRALTARYPRGHFSELAQVERMRALKRLGDNASAAAEARRYLSEHGREFAREEVRGIALGEK